MSALLALRRIRGMERPIPIAGINSSKRSISRCSLRLSLKPPNINLPA